MTCVNITYLGKEYSYQLLAADELIHDRIIPLRNYEISVQGYEQCYNETRQFHFLTTKQELAKLKELR